MNQLVLKFSLFAYYFFANIQLGYFIVAQAKLSQSAC